jgi:hypothetical protein
LVSKLSVKGTPKLWPKQVERGGGKGSLHGKSGSRMRAAELESSEAGLMTVAMG